jgi:oligoribonuclease NrnB/cAMP/cGMP phosphodiesterase (DHH superfamily)
MSLLIRFDFDGLVCAAILKELGIVNQICYVHSKDMQDNKIKAAENDVIANVPYGKGCSPWFDHHSSEVERLQLKGGFEGACEPAPSSARVILNYYKAFHREHYTFFGQGTKWDVMPNEFGKFL